MMLFTMLFLSLPKMLLSFFLSCLISIMPIRFKACLCVVIVLVVCLFNKGFFSFCYWWSLCIECTQLQWGCSFWGLFRFKKLPIYKFVELHSQNRISLENITNHTLLKVFKCAPTNVRFYLLYEQTHVLAPPSFQSSHQHINIMFTLLKWSPHFDKCLLLPIPLKWI